jgi:glutamate synthase domain-containing protein 3
VVEGVGDHGCEYMTGGVVAVLGETGRNFAAGMSGGIAFVRDDDGSFHSRCNLAMVDVEPITEHEDVVLLTSLLEQHAELTGSAIAVALLSEGAALAERFRIVVPHDLRRVGVRAPAAVLERVA